MTQITDQNYPIIEALDISALAEKTVFLSLKFGSFGNSRKADLDVNTEANKSRFRHQKQLLNSPELKAIGQADIAIKAAIAHLCLPTTSYDVSTRVVPHENVVKVGKILKTYAEIDRPLLVEAFLAKYEDQVSEASKELKEQFNNFNYPSKIVAKNKFFFLYQFQFFGVPGALKTVAPEIWQEEQAKANVVLMDAAQQVASAMRHAAHEVVQKLADGLSGEVTADGKPKKLYSAHVEKLNEFLASFDILNKANDKELKADMDNLKSLMDGVDIEKIRHNDGLRTELASKVTVIAKDLLALSEVTGRKFRDTPESPVVETVETQAEAIAQ